MRFPFGRKQTEPTFQDADVHYVNVFFTYIDGRYDDMYLLRTMQTVVRGDLAIISSRPMMLERPLCCSIEVRGTYTTKREILDAADHQIYLWVRSLPTDGLPFSRREVFQRDR
ncbi:uncharacterized protein N7459_002649 [Penicillium hispanicum]|uniref:uncharacterized protein n=1 Tax=Penicillium hispanicum TaxID=1080232 RepID=UPI002540897C|nr:uncharacterized protein N7459_002649 [Penicillium hispanicum]KAJ5586884.1 hypothetical protein N7459_002649 [Penicillium hispanicum]